MSLMQGRGGIPRVIRATIDATGRAVTLPVNCNFIQLRTSTNACRLYFLEEDFVADANYIEVPIAAAATPWGWSGPAEVDHSTQNQVWIKGVGGNAAIELTAYQRRG